MSRLAVVALLLRMCASPEPARQSLPPRPALRSWSASMMTTGGYSGGGKEAVFISSEEKDSPCSVQHLSPQTRAALDAVVAEARPQDWKPIYRPEVEHMTDQFYYSFTFKIERSDGTGGSYSVGWQSESEEMLPRDLRRLSDALWAAQAQCP